MEFHLEGKNALVIASSQGLGKAVAAELVKEGANVMLTSRDAEKLAAVQKELTAWGSGKVVFCACDITQPEQIKNLVAQTHEKLGPIQLLFNNAGGPPSGDLEDFSDEAWQYSFELNLLSYIRIIREVLPDLKKQGGKIVNNASISVKSPLPNMILSNTFRSGITGLSKSLAEELAEYNILVNVVAPGTIATDRIKKLHMNKADKSGNSLEEVKQAALAAIPLGRMGSPEEYARAVVFLLSGANTYLTGVTLSIDGGQAKVIP